MEAANVQQDGRGSHSVATGRTRPHGMPPPRPAPRRSNAHVVITLKYQRSLFKAKKVKCKMSSTCSVYFSLNSLLRSLSHYQGSLPGKVSPTQGAFTETVAWLPLGVAGAFTCAESSGPAGGGPASPPLDPLGGSSCQCLELQSYNSIRCLLLPSPFSTPPPSPPPFLPMSCLELGTEPLFPPLVNWHLSQWCPIV